MVSDGQAVVPQSERIAHLSKLGVLGTKDIHCVHCLCQASSHVHLDQWTCHLVLGLELHLSVMVPDLTTQELDPIQVGVPPVMEFSRWFISAERYASQARS